MAKGTTFGDIHSNRDLRLIQQLVEVQPAEPKTNYKDIPGGNGDKDLTEALGVGVKYKDREITWTFALYPREDWYEKQREVSGALNGLACHIVLDDDPDYYYDGRLTVSSHKSDKLLRQITVTAKCRPYKRKHQETIVSLSGIGSTYVPIAVINDRMPVVPLITVSEATSVRVKGTVYSLEAGSSRKYLNIQLDEGPNVIEVKVTGEDEGAFTMKYTEGAL